MSEEEILEIIEKLQCEYKEQQNDKKYNDYTVFKANEYSKGLQGLLDLYEKEKLNNFSLSDKLNKEKEKNKKIEDKIKGKIKELNELLKETQKELGSASIEFNIYAHQKDILNCLLEE